MASLHMFACNLAAAPALPPPISKETVATQTEVPTVIARSVLKLKRHPIFGRSSTNFVWISNTAANDFWMMCCRYVCFSRYSSTHCDAIDTPNDLEDNGADMGRPMAWSKRATSTRTTPSSSSKHDATQTILPVCLCTFHRTVRLAQTRRATSVR